MIQTVTNVDEKHIMQFNMYAAKKRLWFPIAVMVFLFIIGIFCCLDKSIGLITGIVFIVLGAIMPPVYWTAVIVLVKRNVKNSTMLKSELVQTIQFDDKIYISEKNKYIKSNNVEYAWEVLTKAVETDDSFYLYINKVQAFIVGKDCFITGNASDLHDLLAQKIEAKKFIFNSKRNATRRK